MRKKIRRKEAIEKARDSEKELAEFIENENNIFEEEKQSMVILKVHNGEEYPIKRDQFLVYCNNLGKRLKEIPEDKNVKILLPEWVDENIVNDISYLSILKLQKEEASEIFK